MAVRSLEAVIAAMVSFFVFTVLLAIVFLVCKSRKSKSRSSGRTTRSRAIPNPPLLTSVAVDESASFDPSLRVSMNEIIEATKSFSPDLIVGDGSFGFVYKAQLPNGPLVAIKKLDPDAFQGFREFRAEMETLSKVQHKNLVRILGYCVSGSDRILIYEFIERGNLDFWLHDYSSSTSSSSSTTEGGGDNVSGLRLPLSWETRNKIIRGVANGLCYLHGLDKPIIHRDIKASNVLLDSEFEAHISDFGLARMIDSSHSHVSTQFAGTMGYMPPEYKEGLTAATVKADVYSFGVLMLETATGKRPNLPQKYDGQEIMGWVEWARKMVDNNRQMEMVDQNISRQGLDEARVKEYFRIACMCVDEMSKKRPTMSDVVQLLKQNSK
ncbi:phytosulfokine receptor 2 [Ziziphus jujuba]|uniref:Phytosulfokine receptor 2 n=1 Tax=Ziziphus jujuba TaxID=326968 RepID=A0A6P4AKW7_ZIZJJ|nr:phytosulfokine receptor 2 [Ziziphus jujuba]